MQQQMMQQQMQQQQQMAFLNSMNNYQQQQMMPQITGQVTGAPAIGSNNPFSAFAQKPAMTGQPFNTNSNNNFNTSNGFDSGLNSGFNSNPNNGFSSGFNNGFNNGLGNGLGSNSNTNTNNTNNSNSLGELSFLQDSMTKGSSPPVSSQPVSTSCVLSNSLFRDKTQRWPYTHHVYGVLACFRSWPRHLGRMMKNMPIWRWLFRAATMPA